MEKRGRFIALLGIFALVFLGSIAIVAAANEGGVIGALLGPFGNIEKAYDNYSTLIDAAIYLIIFLGLTQVTLGKKFTGQGGKAVTTGVAIVFALGLALFEKQANFNIKSFGPIAALVLVALVGYAIWVALKDFNIPCLGKDGSGALVYSVVYLCLAATVPGLITWIQEKIPILGALMTLLLLVCLIIFVIRLIYCIMGAFTGRGLQGGTPGTLTPPDPNKPRLPGKPMPPTPPSRNPKDPRTPTTPKPGIEPVPRGPKPKPKPVKPGPKVDPDKEIRIDLSPGFNPIRSQDATNACTAFAAASIFEYGLHVHEKHSKLWLSPMYLWYKSRQRQGFGDENRNMGLYYCGTAMESLIKDGLCIEPRWEFEAIPSPKFRTSPDGAAEADAVARQALEYRSVSRSNPDQWVNELLDSNPLNIAVRVPVDWGKPFNKRFYHNLTPSLSGGHAMVVVGYHSHYPHEGKGVPAFKLRNSWDTDWGENGYLWITAETLVKTRMISEDLLVLKGWKKGELKKFTFSGRAVFDFKDKPINGSKSGVEIYKDKELRTPDHEFVVGAMVQKKGNLISLGETTVPVKYKGKFKLQIEADLSSIEQLTMLPEKYPNELGGIDFRKLPAGVVIYKRNVKDDGEYYFHITHFNFSHAGRGGEGAEHPENPNTVTVHPEIEILSGRPIVFSKDHTAEANIVIPICFFNKNKKSLTEEEILAIGKIRGLAKDELGQLGAEFEYLEKLKVAIETDNYKDELYDQKMVGRAEARAQRFEKGIEKELAKLIEIVQGPYKPKLEGVLRTLKVLSKKLVEFSSRYTGLIKKDVVALKNAHDKPGSVNEDTMVLMKRKAENDIGGAITDLQGLDAELKKLEKLDDYILEKLVAEEKPQAL